VGRGAGRGEGRHAKASAAACTAVGWLRRPMGARIAGRLGVGLQSIRADLHAEYLTGLEQGGHDPSIARMSGPIEFFVADDPEKAWAEIQEHVEYRWNSYNATCSRDQPRGESPKVGDDGAVGGRFEIGTPEQIAGIIKEATAGLPVTDIYGWSDYPGMPDDLVDRHIELTFTKVAPLLK